jgi:PIN domain nuclease of toxin-antitoxin system
MGGPVIVLDTHALLWWALDPKKLSGAARQAIKDMEERGGFVCSISFWELGHKIKKKELSIGIAIEEFARRIERSGTLEIVPVDTTLWLSSLALRWDHRDPADRVIVATALAKGVPLLTKDLTIRAFDGVKTLW